MEGAFVACFCYSLFEAALTGGLFFKKSMEDKALKTLTEASCKVKLGGREFEFKPISLADREKISVLAAKIDINAANITTDGEMLNEAIRCGKYARHLAAFITVGAHIRDLPLIASIKRKRLFKAAFHRASNEEIMHAVICILEHIEPAFFLKCIISLNRQNILKSTKETEATAHG
jgi:hypothetical protein